ncbi:siderophore-interacting protein [Grimontia sp. NTOU-MAR1]|uniref:siderophore-interacting protein n=1 Tax=Grimontia sp. NTOU-MAR1 TaxID=3111011 RepID=UPI002DB86685|nr:siderophore-interacting protein [Grimontia sp. NTOU-MAR1]WRW01033.1 siderophore-interacting protein [Grimontia sp. NTOU-MAR1]
MNKPSPILLTVEATTAVTPNMQRIVMHGEGLCRFPTNCEGGYIKLLFAPDGSTDLSSLTADQRPVMRTYTIRDLDFSIHTITVDFVRHTIDDCGCGHAARWAMNAKVGDTINIAGPGTIQEINKEADWFFMVADMTALPALSVKIATLPHHALGHAVIEVESEDDIQPLHAPEGMQIDWLVKGEKTLAGQVRDKKWFDGEAAVWCACEFDSMRALRQYFRNDREVDRENIYISSYWKDGVTEEGHKVIKRKDAEAIA